MSPHFLKEEKKKQRKQMMIIWRVGFVRQRVVDVAVSRQCQVWFRGQEGSPGLQTAQEIMKVFPDTIICFSKALGLAAGPSPGKDVCNSLGVHT